MAVLKQLEFLLEFLLVAFKILPVGIAQGGKDANGRPYQLLMALHGTHLIYTHLYKGTLVLIR